LVSKANKKKKRCAELEIYGWKKIVSKVEIMN
jgi:hypothetical protein